jgi:DNA-binding response OmpR family regulator
LKTAMSWAKSLIVSEARLKILVIEDDSVYAEFVATTLQAAGHEITLAETGAAARAQAKSVRPDAVILDLGLPDESGFDTARALRAGILPERSIIILLTASMYPDRDAADAIGIDFVLSKPVEAEVVSGMIDLVRARREKRIR